MSLPSYLAERSLVPVQVSLRCFCEVPDVRDRDLVATMANQFDMQRLILQVLCTIFALSHTIACFACTNLPVSQNTAGIESCCPRWNRKLCAAVFRYNASQQGFSIADAAKLWRNMGDGGNIIVSTFLSYPNLPLVEVALL